MEKEVKQFDLETVIAKAIQVPGVKVERSKFLAEEFAEYCNNLDELIEKGPIEVGMDQKTLDTIASKLIFKRTSQSSIASFTAGVPGGFALAATIPLDIVQFFAFAFRLAQELSYIYGADDIFKDGIVDDEKVRNNLLIYCGVMFGVSRAISGVRVLSTQIAKTVVKKLPQKALTKTFWYPIIKKIASAIGAKMTKSMLANGVSKVVPFVGGFISGAINWASMIPMAQRLKTTLEKSCFDYSDEEYNADIDVVLSVDANAIEDDDKFDIKDKFFEVTDVIKNNVKSLVSKQAISKQEQNVVSNDPYEELKKLKELLDMDIITKEEFSEKKKKLLNL